MESLQRAVMEYEKEMHPRALKLHEQAEMLAKLLNNSDSPGNDWKDFMEEYGATEEGVVQVR